MAQNLTQTSLYPLIQFHPIVHEDGTMDEEWYSWFDRLAAKVRELEDRVKTLETP